MFARTRALEACQLAHQICSALLRCHCHALQPNTALQTISQRGQSAPKQGCGATESCNKQTMQRTQKNTVGIAQSLRCPAANLHTTAGGAAAASASGAGAAAGACGGAIASKNSCGCMKLASTVLPANMRPWMASRACSKEHAQCASAGAAQKKGSQLPRWAGNCIASCSGINVWLCAAMPHLLCAIRIQELHKRLAERALANHLCRLRCSAAVAGVSCSCALALCCSNIIHNGL